MSDTQGELKDYGDMAAVRSIILVVSTILLPRLTSTAQIVQGPVSAAVAFGGQVTLKCQVTGKGTDPIRWFRIDTHTIISTDGRVIKRSLRKRYRIVGNREQGEYHLYIRNALLVDNGTFACGVLSDVRERHIMSVSADLAVVKEPICTITSTRPPNPGVSVTMSCQSQNSGLDVALSWHRPAQPDLVFRDTADANVSSGGLRKSINITLGPTDVGESFICMESLVHADFSRSCTITPLKTHLPVILYPPNMISVQGQNGTFTCIIASKNSLTYEWYINGVRDFNARGSKYVISPVTVQHNNTEIECRTRDEVTGMLGNATSTLYVHPISMSLTTTVTVDEDSSSQSQFSPIKSDIRATTLDTAIDPVQPDSLITEVHPTLISKATSSSGPVGHSVDSNMNSSSSPAVIVNDQPLNVANPQQTFPTYGGDNKWGDMMIPVLVVGSIIAVLLICVIVVLLLFLVRQNRVAHGSVHGKEEQRKGDIHLDEIKPADSASPTHQGDSLKEETSEVNVEEELIHPKYFTLEPGKRKVRRLERTTSHVILSDSSSEYNLLSKNGSLRLPSGVLMNDYARPGLQMGTFDGDMSTVSAYAVTDVTLGRGTTSLKRSRSCLRPLPAAPVEAALNRSHYSIPREACVKIPCQNESSGDSETSRWGVGLPESFKASNRRSLCVRPYVPAGDEYAEIDSPPCPASPVSTDCSRPSSPDLPRERHQNNPALTDLTISLAGSYESGYDAASSDEIMDCDSTSQYATIDVSSQNSNSPTEKSKPTENESKTKDFPVYAKVKRNRGTQVEDANIDNYQEELNEAIC
ncbi:uncharacterized protein [Diadema setosum]|uniref:uncharacterized protein n=1 Tax=Diadema setosum TaxID=31175 RepID=UPI003B3B3826